MNLHHTTAMVIIPPQDIWEPIQKIRSEHDRNIRRWMPHITLFYPFIAKESFYDIKYNLEQTCKHISPFTINLSEIGYFKQRKGNFILWVGPQEQPDLQAMYKSISNPLQKIMEIKKRPFHPHLTIGRMRNEKTFHEVEEQIKFSWQSLKWNVDKVSLIWRNEPPDDVFRIEYEIPLGE